VYVWGPPAVTVSPSLGSNCTLPAKESNANRKRRDGRSRSRSAGQEKTHRRRKKSKHTPSAETEPNTTDSLKLVENGTIQETEEEYDARLEREERERMAEAKRRELERIQQTHEHTYAGHGSVRFKGMHV
jgi:peptidyl-prolyl isomerase G (cyclophilin G)